MDTQQDVDRHAGEIAASLNRGRRQLVLGLPGTGKTAVLTAVFAQLSEHFGADSALVLTPSRDHADVLRDSLPAAGVRQAAAARSIHSFAFGLVSAATAVSTGVAAHFISGADQDAQLSEQLAGYLSGVVPNTPQWPDSMNEQIRSTVEFRGQLRDALAEVMGPGFSFSQVHELAAAHGRPEWQVLAHIGREYEEILALRGHAEVDTAAVFAHATAVVQTELDSGTAAGRAWSFNSAEPVPRFLLIDAAQDIPDAALPLLQKLEELGIALALFASPETATQSFRSATGEVLRSALALSAQDTTDVIRLHPQAAGRHRGAISAAVLESARLLSADLHLGHVPATGYVPGDSQVFTKSSPSQADHLRFIADAIRTALQNGIAPADIAVLARTSQAAAQISIELETLNIPVSHSVLPLAIDPAAGLLLQALSTDADDPYWGELAHRFLSGEFGRLDSLAMRALVRAVARVLAGAGDESASAANSADLLWAAVNSTAEMPERIDWVRKIYRTAVKAQERNPRQAVWEVWDATGVAQEWQRQGAADPAAPVNQRIDAVLRLQALAEKSEDGGLTSARVFSRDVQEQNLAQDSLAPAAQAKTVTVSTPAAAAHRDFHTVIVVDLVEGVWPNPRVRGSIFHTAELRERLRGTPEEEMASTDYRLARRKTIAEEAKLFMSAISRARETLIVAAVANGDSQPSIFYRLIDEADCSTEYPTLAHRVAISSAEDTETLPTSLAALSGIARRELAATGDYAWADLLNALAAAGVRAAAPANWTTWQQASSTQPAVAQDETVTISPSDVESFAECQLKWFLQKQGGRTQSTRAQSMGMLIHAIAQHHPLGGLADMRNEFVDGFADIEFESEWERSQELEVGLQMLDNLQEYLQDPERGEFLGAELSLYARADDDHETGPWAISGRIDRLERHPSGGVKVVDFKTSNTPISVAKAETNMQLAAYQVGIEMPGAVLKNPETGETLSWETAAGAELVYPKKGKGTRTQASNIREQAALAANPELREETMQTLRSVVTGSRSHVFLATPSPDICRNCPVKSSCPALTATEDSEK